MNLKTVIIAFFILSIELAYAQFDGFGMRLGGHYSRQYLDINSSSSLDDDLQDLAPDFQLGVFGNFKLSPVTDVSPAINYIRKPYKESYFSFVDTANNFEVNETLIPRWDYISVDVPFKFHTRNDNMVMYMYIGLRFDYLINTKEIIRQDSSLYEWYYDDFKKLSMGYIAGLGAEYTLNDRFNILFEFTYNRDITNVYSSPDLRVKNELMAFTIGLKFKTIKQGRVPASSLEPEPLPEYQELEIED